MVTSHHLERTASLMAYLAAITKASTRYKWPLWVVYDLSPNAMNYRQMRLTQGRQTGPVSTLACMQNVSITWPFQQRGGVPTVTRQSIHQITAFYALWLKRGHNPVQQHHPPNDKSQSQYLKSSIIIFNGDCSFGTSLHAFTASRLVTRNLSVLNYAPRSHLE